MYGISSSIIIGDGVTAGGWGYSAALKICLPTQRIQMSKRGTKVIERPGLSEEEIEEIREAFNLFDAGKFVLLSLLLSTQ